MVNIWMGSIQIQPQGHWRNIMAPELPVVVGWGLSWILVVSLCPVFPASVSYKCISRVSLLSQPPVSKSSLQSLLPGNPIKWAASATVPTRPPILFMLKRYNRDMWKFSVYLQTAYQHALKFGSRDNKLQIVYGFLPPYLWCWCLFFIYSFLQSFIPSFHFIYFLFSILPLLFLN